MRRPDWTGVLQGGSDTKPHTHVTNQKWYGSSFPKFNALSLDIGILFHIPHPSHSQPILGVECNIIHRSDNLEPCLCCPSWAISYKTGLLKPSQMKTSPFLFVCLLLVTLVILPLLHVEPIYEGRTYTATLYMKTVTSHDTEHVPHMHVQWCMSITVPENITLCKRRVFI